MLLLLPIKTYGTRMGVIKIITYWINIAEKMDRATVIAVEPPVIARLKMRVITFTSTVWAHLLLARFTKPTARQPGSTPPTKFKWSFFVMWRITHKAGCPVVCV